MSERVISYAIKIGGGRLEVDAGMGNELRITAQHPLYLYNSENAEWPLQKLTTTDGTWVGDRIWLGSPHPKGRALVEIWTKE